MTILKADEKTCAPPRVNKNTQERRQQYERSHVRFLEKFAQLHTAISHHHGCQAGEPLRATKKIFDGLALATAPLLVDPLAMSPFSPHLQLGDTIPFLAGCIDLDIDANMIAWSPRMDDTLAQLRSLCVRTMRARLHLLDEVDDEVELLDEEDGSPGVHDLDLPHGSTSEE